MAQQAVHGQEGQNLSECNENTNTKVIYGHKVLKRIANHTIRKAMQVVNNKEKPREEWLGGLNMS